MKDDWGKATKPHHLHRGLVLLQQTLNHISTAFMAFPDPVVRLYVDKHGKLIAETTLKRYRLQYRANRPFRRRLVGLISKLEA